MQDAQTIEGLALTEEDELYWRIYAPKTRRLDVGVTWESETVSDYAPTPPTPPRRRGCGSWTAATTTGRMRTCSGSRWSH